MPIVEGSWNSRQYSRQCKGKKKHRAEVSAQKALESGLKKDFGQDLAVYWCRFCGCWHVGHAGRLKKNSNPPGCA